MAKKNKDSNVDVVEEVVQPGVESEQTPEQKLDQVKLEAVAKRVEAILLEEGYGIQPFVDPNQFFVALQSAARVRLIKLPKENNKNGKENK